MSSLVHLSNQYLLAVGRTFPGPILSSQKVLRELLQARRIWGEKEVSTFYVFENQLHLLDLIYKFRGREEIIRFLSRNRFLPPILIETYFKIRSYFLDSPVILEIDTDPEVTMSEQLIVFIVTKLFPGEALAKLKQFDEDWWLGNSDQVRMKLCINLEFE
jgi:hypothetical protein